MEFEQFGLCIPLSITIYMDYAFILFSIVCAPDPRALPTLATASRPKSVSHPPSWRYPLRFAFRIRQRCRHLASILPPIANQNLLFFSFASLPFLFFLLHSSHPHSSFIPQDALLWTSSLGLFQVPIHQLGAPLGSL